MSKLAQSLINAGSLTAGKYNIKPRFFIILAIVILLIFIICFQNWDKLVEIVSRPKFTSNYMKAVFYGGE